MTSRKNMEYAYTKIDRIFRLSMGETADYGEGLYDGDYSLTLEEAHRRKNASIVEHLNLQNRSRVLDIGSGWGGFLSYAKDINIEGVGITLSSGQAHSSAKNGLDVHIKDYNDLRPDSFGLFDGVVNLGVAAHFCSLDEWLAGKQDAIYQNFFRIVHSVLKPGGKCFVSSTVIDDENMLEYDDLDIHANHDSDGFLMALLMRCWGDGWLPYGSAQLERCAEPYFKVIHRESGRLDYIETINQWLTRYRRFNLKKYLIYLSMIPQILTDKTMRYRWLSMRVNPHRVGMERRLIDHYRWVLEKQ